jgi:hypothetical protein
LKPEDEEGVMTNEPNDTPEARQVGATEADVPATAEPVGDSGSPGKYAPSLPPPDYNQAGVPSLDFVRDKIEGRYGRSLGSTELAQETPEARTFEEQATKREEAARDRLAEIRRSLRGDASS